MRVQGDTLEEQRSDEPTPEPLTPLTASSKGSSSAGSLHRETPSPLKSERPGSKMRRGHGSVDRINVSSPLQHSQSDSVPSLNLSSNSPIPSSSPATLSQDFDTRYREGRPSSRNSVSPVPQSDTGQYLSNSRGRSISPIDKAKVRHELEQWAVKGKGGENTLYQQQLNGKVSSLPPKVTPVSSVTRYHPRPRSPPPGITRVDHQRTTEISGKSSYSPTPPLASPTAHSTISYQSTLDSWVMHADNKAVSEAPQSPVRYQSGRVMSPSHIDRQSNRIRQQALYQTTQSVYPPTQGWKPQTHTSVPAIPVQPAAIPARRYSQGRPQVADDRRLLMEGDRLLKRELEETRAEQHYHHHPGRVTSPHYRQLPLSPHESTSSILSNSSVPPAIGHHRQQKQYVSIAGGSAHETRV